MALAIVERAQKAFADLRERVPVVDLVMRIQERYGRTGADQQAGAATYFAFLSFFPILALAVFAVGLVDRVWPDAQKGLTDALNQVIPGLIGTGEGQISLADLESFTGWAGVLGLLGVLYAGTGWIDALRRALAAVFEQPAAEQPNMVKAKLLDVRALAVIGTGLIGSVVGAQALVSFSGEVVDSLGFGTGWLVSIIAHLLSWLVSVGMFFLIYRLVADPPVPVRSLWEASGLAAFGFEVLKVISFAVLGSVRGSPAFQAFGVALVLLVWINYFSRVTFYGASYACEIRPAKAATAAEVEVS
jgi:membrane protein